MYQKHSRAGYKLTAQIAVKQAIKNCQARGDIPSSGTINKAQFLKLFNECQKQYPFKDDLHHQNYSLWCEVRDKLILPMQDRQQNEATEKNIKQLSLFDD